MLIAGDDHEPAFDNAVDAMAETLVRFGVTRSDIPIRKATARPSSPQLSVGAAETGITVFGQ